MSALSPTTRVVTFEITGTGLTPDAIEAAVADMRQLEELYAVNTGAVTNYTDATRVLTGKTPYKVYVFTASLTKASGAYVYELIEVAPNVETSTELNP